MPAEELERALEAIQGSPPAPFVVGVPRSGTTLLRLMLDAHPLLAIPPETHLVQKVVRAWRKGATGPDGVLAVMTGSRFWADFGLEPADLRKRLEAAAPLTVTSALRAFYLSYAASQGKPRWGDKTPEYLTLMDVIQAALPEARFVHVVRDGRDVALSLAEAIFGPGSPGEAARSWAAGVAEGRRQGRLVRHYLEVRFEALVRTPEPVLREVCDFLELPWAPEMLDYHRGAAERLQEVNRPLPLGAGRSPVPGAERVRLLATTTNPPQPARVGRWRTEMSPGDLAEVSEVAGPMLAELGYGP